LFLWGRSGKIAAQGGNGGPSEAWGDRTVEGSFAVKPAKKAGRIKAGRQRHGGKRKGGRPMRKLYSTLAAIAAAALMLPSAAQAQANKLVVGMPTTPPNVVHMPVIVAKDLGLYKKEGIEVETVALEDGVKVFRAMLAGNIDVGMSPGAVTIIGRSNGAAVKAILATSNKFEASMVVRDNVKTMADLKGKRIGIQQPGGFADINSRAVLRAAKIDPKEVNFVSIATEDVPALVANQVDTGILHVEQEMLAKTKVPSLHAIARMWELQPKTLYTVAAVTEKTIKDKHAALEAFVRANIEATRIMYSDKARVMPILVKHTGYPEKIISETYDFLVKNCIWDANSGLSPERVNFTANLMTKVGNIKEGKTPKYDDIVDVSFAKDAIAKLGEWKGPVCPTAAF
jgi:ABC-type nitrate/sulfonate/bicarbonate transport system substrate-binding protein